MKAKSGFLALLLLALFCLLGTFPTDKSSRTSPSGTNRVALAQAPGWSPAHMQFFLHGSMSTEFVPESVLRAFIQTKTR